MGNELLTPPHTITYRIYREGDEHAIIRLRKEVTGKDMSLEEWHWKFKGQGDKKVYSVIMEEKTHDIIGHWGGIPLKMLHDKKEIKVIAVCNVMIHPKFRSFVRFKKLNHTFMEEATRDSVTFVYGFPTEKTFMLPAERLGIWERLEVINESVKDVRLPRTPGRYLYQLAPIDSDDERIDVLWDAAKHQFKLSIIRDSSYLSWRYKRNPIFKYQIWGLRKRWSRDLMALVVLRREEENVIITDMVFRNGILPILFSKVENLVYSICKGRLRLFMPQRFTPLLKEMGFSSQPSGATIAKPVHPSILNKDEVLKKFFFYTMGDTDYM